MKVKELIEELEYFAEQYGEDIEVAVNRNGRAYPVYILTSGVYPAYTDGRIKNSGYFSYLDEEDDMEDFDGDVPMPNLAILND